MESLRADYTEVWCAEQNVPLARFADGARSIVSAGLDRLGFLAAEDAIERMRGFDQIVSWYGTNRAEFRELTAKLRLPFTFLPALPGIGRHAVDFYNTQAMELGGARPSRFPVVPCPPFARTFAAVHPFASSALKRAPLEQFQIMAASLAVRMPVRWLRGPEEQLDGAEVFENLFDVACLLRGARIFVGNDTGISHLAAAVGTPCLAIFRATNAAVWSPRGPAVWTTGPAPPVRATPGV
jgi:ADP-heptose:LPS heptosyltransferase